VRLFIVLGADARFVVAAAFLAMRREFRILTCGVWFRDGNRLNWRT
jgi:hypothetical protein